MKNICFCFVLHAPYRLKRYRFFEIGQDHYYYDDMQTEDQITHWTQTSYLPLCYTLLDMIKKSKGNFHCGMVVTGIMMEMFEQFAPEMIDLLKELAKTQCVEFLSTPYAYSLSSEYNMNEWVDQIHQHQAKMQDVLGVTSSSLWNTELLYSDELAVTAQKLGFKVVLTEGAKHILSWKSPNYMYHAASATKLKVLLRNRTLSDDISFHFTDYNWKDYPLDAEKFTGWISDLPQEEQVVNLWMGAETFGLRQNAGSGIFEFLKAIPYFASQKGINFSTPFEAAKKFSAQDAIVAPYPITWTGEAKDLGAFNGNDLQQEALNKLYAASERVRLCNDMCLKRDWLMLQAYDHFLFMNHVDAGPSNYESAYDAFINYMNVLSDFLQLVEEQYPTTIENEELNELLKTINNQEKEIALLEKEITQLKKRKK